jgi:hypothetical protein
VFGVALALLFLAGCSSEETLLIPKALLLGVLVLLKEKKKLQFAFGEKRPAGEQNKTDAEMLEDRDKAWFICKRAEAIGHRHPTFDKQTLADRVEAQFDRIVTYINSKLGANAPLNGYAEPGGDGSGDVSKPFESSPTHHFDLDDIAQTRRNELMPLGKRDEFRSQRHRAVRTIAWHAAGLYDELWTDPNDPPNNRVFGDGSTLNVPALDELLDRRLRSVERMRLQLNSEGGAVTGTAGRGPWTDGSRVRVFEYPQFAKRLVSAADVSPRDAALDFNKIWLDFTPSTVKYNWPAPRGLVARFGPEPGPDATFTSPDWAPAVLTPGGQPESYSRAPTAGPIAPKLDNLFKSAFDIWDRTWLFCDISISAIHLEALRFAMARRPNSGDLDALIRGPADQPRTPFLGGIIDGAIDYDPVTGNPIRTVDDQSLWSDGQDTGAPLDTGVFDNLLVRFRDLQVGDHVVMWNSHLYQFVTAGFWRLENAFVTELDIVTDHWDEGQSIGNAPIDPTVFMMPNKNTLQLDGFGAGAVARYPEFRQHMLQTIQDGIRNIYRAIAQLPSAQAFNFRQAHANPVVFPWNPYQTGVIGTPWWIFLTRLTPGSRGSVYPNVGKMLEVIPHTVINDPNRGTGYQPPNVQINGQTVDLTDGVFFPLYMPQVDGKEMEWSTYFEKRKNGVVVAQVRPTTLTSDLVPALFVGGKTQPFEIIRPRLRVRV